MIYELDTWNLFLLQFVQFFNENIKTQNTENLMWPFINMTVPQNTGIHDTSLEISQWKWH